ncbi:hypothetical protein HWI79_1226 [Cryptosporidium felis]|nr:hypothetical protein HWI79_1226 [Cryptosporidium felis]
MNSDVLRVRYRRELSSLSLGEEVSRSSEKRDLAIWLFEWYDSKGRKLPYSQDEGRLDKVPIEELNFLKEVLEELPGDFPMIRFSTLWSNWLLPHVKMGLSKEYDLLWAGIMELIERKFPNVFLGDIDSFVNSVSYYLQLDPVSYVELCYTTIKLLRKLISMYVPPRKGFALISGRLIKPLEAYYSSKIHVNSVTSKVRREIEKLLQTTVSEKHLSSFVSILRVETLTLIDQKTPSLRQNPSSNYTMELFKAIIGEEPQFDYFIFTIIKQIYETERLLSSDLSPSTSIGSEYLLFFLYLSINLRDQTQFLRKIQALNECFDFFIEKNTFNIRESTDEFGNNFKLRIYDIIFEKLHNSISLGYFNPDIWRLIENSILIDPIRSLEFLPDIFISQKGNFKKPIVLKLQDRATISPASGLTEIILSFISGKKLETGKYPALMESSLKSEESSLITCISKYILTFMKLHDLPLLFNTFSEILSSEIVPKDRVFYEEIFLNFQVLQVIKDNIGHSTLPGQISNILDSFFEFMKANISQNHLFEVVSSSWTGVLLVAIPLSEPSLSSIENILIQIHSYVRENARNYPKSTHLTTTLGMIHTVRKLISWNIEKKGELLEILNFHFSRIIDDLNVEHQEDGESSQFSKINSCLIHLIIHVTKIRDSMKISKEDFAKTFHIYNDIISLITPVPNLTLDKYSVDKILIIFIITNLSSLQEARDFFNMEDLYWTHDSFLRSFLKLFIFQNSISKSLLNSILQVPNLPLLLFKLTLESITPTETSKDLKRSSIKKRKLDSKSIILRQIPMFHLAEILDFWGKKEIIVFFVNVSDILDENPSKLISKFYFNLLFNSDNLLSPDRNNLPVEKIVEGVTNWIHTEDKAGTSDFLGEFSAILFRINEEGTKDNISHFLTLISDLRDNPKLLQKLSYIFKRVIKFASMDERKLQEINKEVVYHMKSLNWWWWRDVDDKFEEILSLNMSWISQIQFCIDLSLDLDLPSLKGDMNIIVMLGNLKKRFRKRKKTEVLFFKSLCELYLKVNPNIQDWNFSVDSKKIAKFCGKDSGIEKVTNEILYKLNILSKIQKSILEEIREVFIDPEKSESLLNENFSLLDLVISYLKRVIETMNSFISEGKKKKGVIEDNFTEIEKVYLGIFEVIFKVLQINLKFGIFVFRDSSVSGSCDLITLTEWNRYFSKCVLEGNTMRKEDYRHSPSIYRHMDIHEALSILVNGSITSLLNKVFHGIVTSVNFTSEDLFLILTYLDLSWGIFKNKGYIYKSLSPCLRGRPYSKVLNWGSSDKLEFNIELLVSKLMSGVEKKFSDFKDEYIVCTFSFIRLSNIISILYSCCMKSYILEGKGEGSGGAFSTCRIVSMSNLLLTIAGRLSNFGSRVRFERLETLAGTLNLDKKTRESLYLSLFECLTIPPYILLYTLLNPLWDQSSRKKNKGKEKTGHIDVWIAQFHLIEEALKNLINLGDQISLCPMGLKAYTVHNKRISRIFPLVVSQITKNKVKRYSISIAGDLINYINLLNKRLEGTELNEEARDIINMNIQIIKGSCLSPILSVIDGHCKQALFTLLKDEQRIIFKQIVRKSSESLSFF